MGQYACKICVQGGPPKTSKYAAVGSYEFVLVFTNGNRWKMPIMILHYLEHDWLPPVEFIQDVESVQLAELEGELTYVDKTAKTFDEKFGLRRVGYLGESVPVNEQGSVSDLFLGNLDRYLNVKNPMPGRRRYASFSV